MTGSDAGRSGINTGFLRSPTDRERVGVRVSGQQMRSQPDSSEPRTIRGQVRSDHRTLGGDAVTNQITADNATRVTTAQLDARVNGWMLAERDGVRVLMLRDCPALTDVLARAADALGEQVDLWIAPGSV